MRKCAFFWVVLVILAFQAGMLTNAQADVVGSVTQVEGRVDVLRGGKLPAIGVKLNDEVQVGDVIRTKSQARAQITFIDKSTLTISPESRVGIEAYMFNSSQNKRNAVVQLFQGLAHVAVSKIFKAAEPDFVVKTQTAIMGVRGTDFGVRIYPSSSDVLNFEGLLQVGNILPQVSQRFLRAFKVAYSFSPGGAGQSWVFLKAMQGTTVGLGLPPSAVFAVTPAMKSSFMDLFSTLGSRGPVGGSTTGGGGVTANAGAGGMKGGASGGDGTTAGSGFLGINPPGTGAIIPVDPVVAGTPVGVVTPPVVVPTTVAPTTTTTTTPTPTLPPHPPR
jgi:hypothetical protein